MEENGGDGIIIIELRELFKPYLLHTSYCDRITIWWNTRTGEYNESVRVYAIEGEYASKVEAWNDCDITSALKYVSNNLM